MVGARAVKNIHLIKAKILPATNTKGTRISYKFIDYSNARYKIVAYNYSVSVYAQLDATITTLGYKKLNAWRGGQYVYIVVEDHAKI